MSRGGRGGRGRGGKPSVFTPQLMGHLAFADIIDNSKIMDVLYPEMEIPETDEPSEVEARIARRYNTMVANSKFSPYWLEAPAKASSDIEKYSDRYQASGTTDPDGLPMARLEDTHIQRFYDKGLLPSAVFEAIFEKKSKKGSRAKVGSRAARRAADALGDDDEDKASVAASDENEDEEEDPELEEEVEEEEEDENDYGDNYFDGGEDDGGEGGDALGGGGDEDGGTFD